MKQELAINLCRDLEVYASSNNLHIGLTGGCLYKDGERKDVDILIYGLKDLHGELEKFFKEIGKNLDVHLDADHIPRDDEDNVVPTFERYVIKAKHESHVVESTRLDSYYGLDFDVDFLIPENDKWPHYVSKAAS